MNTHEVIQRVLTDNQRSVLRERFGITGESNKSTTTKPPHKTGGDNGSGAPASPAVDVPVSSTRS